MQDRMRRWIGMAGVVAGVCVLAAAAPQYFEWVRSASLKDALVDFRAATVSQWQLTVVSQVGADRPDLRLEITNHANQAYLFPITSAGAPVLERADGKPLNHSEFARGLERVQWMLVKPGETYSSPCRVEVKCLPGGTTRQLTYMAAGGVIYTYDPILPGKYKLHFRYNNPTAQVFGGQPTWAGDAETGSVEFEVAE